MEIVNVAERSSIRKQNGETLSMKVFTLSQEELKALKEKVTRAKKKKLSILPAARSALNFPSHLLEALACSAFKAEPFTNIGFSFLEEAALVSYLVVGEPEKPSPFERGQFLRRLGALVRESAEKNSSSEVEVRSSFLQHAADGEVVQFLEGVALGGYRFDRYKEKLASPAKNPQRIALLCKAKGAKLRKLSEEALLFAEATALARDLINTPASDCRPRDLVKAARDIAKECRLDCKVYEQKDLEKLGAGALLAVAKGSSEPPYLIRLVYRPKGKVRKRVALVGKGVTFDTGGYSIKSAQGMEWMKVDMSGAAAVLGAMKIIGTMRPGIEVRAYIPTTENMINGHAVRPGDVAKGISGKTMEILNTDAEGRLILSDALTLAERDKCDLIIDIATLTGACMVALGTEYAGLFSTDERASAQLIEAGEYEGEHLWRMPLPREYRDLIKSQIADIKNTGGPFGGAITAALFLKEFVGKVPWVHLDIAGPANSDADRGFIKKGAVGFGTRTLARFLLDLR